MTNFKEIPLQDEENINESNSSTTIKKRSRLLSSVIYKRLGIVILILASIILPLIIISFFFNAGQPDEIALRIEQITGFVLFSFSLIVGVSLLFTARKLKKDEEIVLEPILEEVVNESH